MIEAAVIRQFSANGALADMDALMTKSNVDKTDFIPGLLMDGQWGGKLYALPFNRSEPILYFNRTLLKEKGLDPNGPKTWDDLRKFAQVLTQRQGNEITRYGFGVWGSNWMYEAMIAQAGGSLLSDDGKSVTMNSQAGIDALSLWTDMALKDKTQMVPTGNNPIAELETAFLNGQVAMQYGSTGGLRGLQDKAKFDLGAAFLPMNKSYGVPTGGTSLVIMAGSKQQDAAFKFVNWMTSTEQSAEYSKATGYMPVRNSTIKAMADFWQTTPNFKVAVDQLAYVKPRPNSPVTPQIHALLDKAIARALLGQQSPKQALDSVKADGDKLLGK
jgi:sn-glycerol 3-phosphate transport system substrate-binding protein